MSFLSKFFLIASFSAMSFMAKGVETAALSHPYDAEKTPESLSHPDKHLTLDTIPANAECLAAEFIAWIQSPDVQRWLREYNAHNDLTESKALDAVWGHLATDSKEVQAVLQHPAAAALRAFQNHYSVLGESFLIGASGGLVAATDRTSDYWQGDEAQFLDTIPLPAGKFRLFNVGLDESSRAMLAKLAIPVYDVDHQTVNDKPMGVLVLGFDQVVVDFERPCNK